MRRPSFQFYPGDWQVNSNLRRCTHAEKGAWLDVMCLMHDQDEYGILRWPLKDIAQSVGAPVSLLRGLIIKGVIKGHDQHLTEPFIYTPRSGRKDGDPVILVSPQAGPIWYSSRMVKDEHVRTVRGESSRFGVADEDKEDALKDAPKGGIGDGSSSSSSSSSSKPLTPGFDDFWSVWPKSTRKGGKSECMRVWVKAGLEAEVEAIVAHVAAMTTTEDWRKQDGAFIPAPVVYLRGRRWDGADTGVVGVQSSLMAGVI